jgi:hypothetical protein
MPNIYIKTRMRKMPECCAECPYFKQQDRIGGEPCDGYDCGAIKMFFGGTAYTVTQRRPAWCPLVEREEQGK